MKKLLLSFCLLSLLFTVRAQPVTVVQEGAWCWFADPRALHYENADRSVNATYIGYIDVHGNVKATQYDWLTGRQTDVLVRSFFQPDDHNNPTFLVLPDERVMIFYTRHTDEPRIWYRISQKPGDITALGEERFLTTANNTTYPSPFILSDDPQHIYLCWRGINWHPTIARLTMPDAQDNCAFDYGPHQIVQSTGARPYAKYTSNGKDKIYLCYTTGHPDNEMPNWLYFNVVDINHGDGPVLRDLTGNQLSKIADGPFRVSKTDDYATSYPATIVDRSKDVRNWVWQIALDAEEHPVIAYTHIDEAKTTHHYHYARWKDTAWSTSPVAPAGHAFHQNWNRTELCYSGGMAIDPASPTDVYFSMPTSYGHYDRDGIYEIWHYTLTPDGAVAFSEQLTKDSPKNNARPYVVPINKKQETRNVGGNLQSPRLTWMQGDYYYWMVNRHYPLGYPTAIMTNMPWQGKPSTADFEELKPQKSAVILASGQKLTLTFHLDPEKYEGDLFTIRLAASKAKVSQPSTLNPQPSSLAYAIGADQHPVITFGDKTFRSENVLLTSDAWATGSNGTNGDSHPTKVSNLTLTLTYDGHRLITWRDGFVDQVILTDTLP